MPATTFDERTAYQADWRYMDGVEDATLVRRKANGEQSEAIPAKLLVGQLSHLDYQRVGNGVGFSPNQPSGYLWLLPLVGGGYPEAPDLEDVVQRTATEQTYVITSIDEPRLGPYSVTLLEEIAHE